MPIKTRRQKKAEAQANLDTPEPTLEPTPILALTRILKIMTTTTTTSTTAPVPKPTPVLITPQLLALPPLAGPLVQGRDTGETGPAPPSATTEAKAEGIDGYDEVQSVIVAAAESLAIVESVDEYKKKAENAQKDVKVVLECAVFGKDWTKDQSDIVAFCLANSKRWIFGLVDRASKRVYHTDEVHTSEGEIGVFEILLAIIFWVSTPSKDILTTISSLN
ncbi:hypothetical protein PLEOSDRAFT_1086990 [Pleurotus ostreatus PC15]|uniref:Uncharacterized protein n=1 Tax=Pleurotus ostreatus (strain PC15) TaxID=1137138 RepID=A0A067NEZ1_PLEO1|nr:hypothetical protein PLEOSDRAFT_1086990 [Pleurotus ostreatus PC15]